MTPWGSPGWPLIPAAYYDQRFYWGAGNPEGPGGAEGLVGIGEAERDCWQSYLTPTDWYVVRMPWRILSAMCPAADRTEYRNS